MWRNFRQLNLLANLLGACGVLILLMSLASWLNRQPIFALRALRIEGATSHLSLQGARAIISQLRGNFFTLDLDAARAAFESMPWVRHASVRRIWPNRLTVTLDEYTPLGTWAMIGWLVLKVSVSAPIWQKPATIYRFLMGRRVASSRWLRAITILSVGLCRWVRACKRSLCRPATLGALNWRTA